MLQVRIFIRIRLSTISLLLANRPVSQLDTGRVARRKGDSEAAVGIQPDFFNFSNLDNLSKVELADNIDLVKSVGNQMILAIWINRRDKADKVERST